MYIRACLLAAFVLMCATAVCDAQQQAPIQPVPSAAELVKAQEFLKGRYGDLSAGSAPDEQMLLAKTLWNDANDAADSAEQYAILCACRDAAARAGDLEASLKVCELLRRKFSVTPGSVWAGTFKAAAIDGEDARQDYLQRVSKAIDIAAKADDFDPARQMIDLGIAAATSPDSAYWPTRLNLRKADLDEQQKYYALIKPDLDHLRHDPTDRASATVVGEYDCFVKGDWKNGIKLLARGDNQALRTLAKTELENPTDTQPQIQIADDWNDQSARYPDQAIQIQLHAFDGYMHALPYATIAPQREHAEEALRDLLPRVASRRDYAAMWLAVGDAIGHRKYGSGVIAAGAKASQDFQDVPQFGGLLTGFHVGYAMAGSQKVITYLQPMYITPTGEEAGKAVGRLYSKLDTIHAPRGYAVGAMKVCGNAGITSITLTFMRIEEDHLNAADTRISRTLGDAGGVPEIIDGQGTPIIGISGRQTDGYLGLGAVYTQLKS